MLSYHCPQQGAYRLDASLGALKNFLVVGKKEEGCSLSSVAYILWELLLGVAESLENSWTMGRK